MGTLLLVNRYDDIDNQELSKILAAKLQIYL
jgi:hypothetical protein